MVKSYSYPMDYEMIRKRKRIQRRKRKEKKVLRRLRRKEDEEARKSANNRNGFRRMNVQSELILENLEKGIEPYADHDKQRDAFKGQVKEFIESLPASKLFYSICPRCLNQSFGTKVMDLNFDFSICGSCCLMLVIDRLKTFRWTFDFCL